MVRIYYWYVDNILKYLIMKERAFINKIIKQDNVLNIIILIDLNTQVD